MGGTASMLGWNYAYDPVIEAFRELLNVPAPTYVDDWAALLRGPLEVLLSSFVLPWLSWAAGLHVDYHECRWLEMGPLTADARRLCQDMPVTVTTTDEGRTRIFGLTPQYVRYALHHTGAVPMDGMQVCSCRCTCTLKTAFVPAGDHDAWTEVLVHTPYGESSVQDSWKYLGVYVTSL